MTDEEWTRSIQEQLHQCGLGPVCGPVDGIYGPRTENAVATFQEAWTYGYLVPDGDVGPETSGPLAACAASGGFISDHFRFQEFASPDTLEVRVLRELVVGLERIREIDGEPLPVVSGYRTHHHNVQVAGASRSVHLWGGAADIPGRHHASTIIALREFSGLGIRAADDIVIHVDVRHVDPMGGHVATTGDPDIWYYR